MPRYFFNWSSSKERHEGVELSDPKEARSVALLAMTQVVQDSNGEIREEPERHMVVTDEAGAIIWELRVQGAVPQRAPEGALPA